MPTYTVPDKSVLKWNSHLQMWVPMPFFPVGGTITYSAIGIHIFKVPVGIRGCRIQATSGNGTNGAQGTVLSAGEDGLDGKSIYVNGSLLVAGGLKGYGGGQAGAAVQLLEPSPGIVSLVLSQATAGGNGRGPFGGEGGEPSLTSNEPTYIAKGGSFNYYEAGEDGHWDSGGSGGAAWVNGSGGEGSGSGGAGGNGSQGNIQFTLYIEATGYTQYIGRGGGGEGSGGPRSGGGGGGGGVTDGEGGYGGYATYGSSIDNFLDLTDGDTYIFEITSGVGESSITLTW